MKRLNNFTRRSVAALAVLITIMWCGAQAARAQDVRPFVDCIERERDANGALTGKYTAYFGYINSGANYVFIPLNTAGNILTPIRSPPNQPNTFLPGVHPRAFSVAINTNNSETWRLTVYSVTASFNSSRLCAADGANSRLITYQGRLSDGGAAANGIYDLQFQLFNAATGGRAHTKQILLEDVTVTNGIFTVQLNLGANSRIYPTDDAAADVNQQLNPAVIDGTDGFFEIGVRPGNSGDAYTILSARQPLTAVPLAMRANTANNAVHAAYADESKVRVSADPDSLECKNNEPDGQFNQPGNIGRQRFSTSTSQFYVCTYDGWRVVQSGAIGGNLNVAGTITSDNLNVGGTISSGNLNVSGTISSGNLNVSGIITSGCRTNFTPILNGRLCISAMQTAATFYGANGAIKACANLGARVGNSGDLMLTIGTSVDYRGGLASGWLADHTGDNVWAVWTNGFGETDFDGIPLNVVSGGANGTMPTLPYRCVY